MKSNSEARPSTVFLFSFSSILTILHPLGSGYHEIKVNELPDWDWAWSDGTKAGTIARFSDVREGSERDRERPRTSENQAKRTKDHGKVILASVSVFAVIHPTFNHAPWKESTIKRSVDDSELCDDQRRKSAKIIWFLSSPWSGFRQLRTACKSDDLSSN